MRAYREEAGRRVAHRGLLDAPGLGEVQLFLPALAQSQQVPGETPWLVWIAPPHEPFAPALAQHGIDLDRLWW